MEKTVQLPLRVATVVGLVVALGAGFVLPFLPGQAHRHLTDVSQDVGIVFFEWMVALIVLAIVIFWERLPLQSIGFRVPSLRDFVAMIVALAGMYGVLAVSNGFAAQGSSGETAAQIATVPLMLRVILVATAGFCEEVMFRAYPIERLTSLTGQLWIGGVAAVVLFTLAHVPRYGFSVSLANVAIIATFLTALYMRMRNFWICAIMHALIDSVGLLIEPTLSRGTL